MWGLKKVCLLLLWYLLCLKKERILDFLLVNWRIKRKLIHIHSLLCFFAILTSYQER